MPNREIRTPRSYDEIVRRTVVDPDSSHRPSKAQQAEAGEECRGERMRAQMTDQERVLYAKLAEQLLGNDSLGEIGFEVENGRVTLHGSVRDAHTIEHLEQLVRSLDGVDDVDNRLVVKQV